MMTPRFLGSSWAVEMETLSHEWRRRRSWHGGGMGDGRGGGAMDLVSDIFEIKTPVGHPDGDVQQAVGQMGTMIEEKREQEM